MNRYLAAKCILLFMIFMNIFLADGKIILAEEVKSEGDSIREKALSSAPQDEIQPDIYGDWVVWKENSSGVYNIFLYNLMASKGKIVSPYSFDQSCPFVLKDKLIWLNLLSEQIVPIQIYDILTGAQKDIGSISSLKGELAVCKDKWKVVWQDMRNGNWDIYMYDLSTNTEKPVCTNPAGQVSPVIYGDKIVWQDMRNGNWDIYMYDLSTNTEIPICINSADQRQLAVYGDKIAWADKRNGNWDIYMYDLKSGK